MDRIKSPEYSKLAEIYDDLMKEVDYELWGDYIDEIILLHHPDPKSILELACGTGSLSYSLDELGYYDILGTDKSRDMISKARNKKHAFHNSVQFEVMDFLDIRLNRTFDAVVSIFDSVNYLHQPKDIRQLLSQVKKVLTDKGLFIFDFATPRNSLQAINYLNNEEGYTSENYRFFRKSRYDANAQIHYNEFEIEKLDEDQESVLERYSEVHRQRIYTLQEMLDIIAETEYKVVEAYNDFNMKKATNKSLRITMVLTCPTVQ